VTGVRVIFFGSGAFGLPTLRWLAEAHEVAAVVSQPDRPAGRRRVLTPTPVAAEAQALSIPLHRPERVNDADVAAAIRAIDARAWVVIAFGQKLGQPLLEGRDAINLHASLLPRWRGAAPIHHAIMSGDATTGVSVITLADRMDAGAVLARREVPIGPTDTTGALHDRLAALGPDVIGDVLESIESGRVEERVQDEEEVTLAGKLSRDDARLRRSMSADDIRRHINGCSPWPGCDATIAGERLRLLRAGPPEGSPPTDGAVTDRGLVGWQGDGLMLLDVQPLGGTAMPFEDWARGRSVQWPTTFDPESDP